MISAPILDKNIAYNKYLYYIVIKIHTMEESYEIFMDYNFS